MDGQDRKLPQPRPEDSDDDAQQEKQETVGYGHPPVDKQFKPGQSGNPAGRPKGSRNRSLAQEVDRWMETFSQTVDRKIIVNDNGRRTEITAGEGILRKLMTNGLKGHFPSQKYINDQMQRISKVKEERLLAELRAAVKYYNESIAEIARCEAAGEPPPMIYPHPADMRFDFNRGVVDIIGPSEPEEQEAWELIDNMLLTEVSIIASVERLQSDLKNQKLRPKERQRLEERLKFMIEKKFVVHNTTVQMSPADKELRLRRLGPRVQEFREAGWAAG